MLFDYLKANFKGRKKIKYEVTHFIIGILFFIRSGTGQNPMSELQQKINGDPRPRPGQD